jgi:uncharacterized membrane protein YfcA
MLPSIYLLIGLVAGMLGGMFGIGGGIVIVPALVLFARFAPHMATGTSLAVFLLPVGALGAWSHYKAGNVRPGAALLIGVGVFLGGYVGARLAAHMSPLALRRGFAVLLAVVAARMWFGK